MFIQPITPEEFISTVKNLPPKQSYGFDEIPMSVIKRVIHCFAQPITSIFNKSFLTGFSLMHKKLRTYVQFIKTVIHLTLKTMDLFPCFPISLKFLKNLCISA